MIGVTHNVDTKRALAECCSVAVVTPDKIRNRKQEVENTVEHLQKKRIERVVERFVVLPHKVHET